MRTLLLINLAFTSCAYQTTTEVLTTTEISKPDIRAHIVPGTTYGNVALQGETIEAARDILAAKTAMPNCLTGQMEVHDTWPLGNPEPSQHNDAFLRWEELWTFDACGRSIDAEVIYMLHRSSGIINVEVSPVKDGQAIELPSPS